MNFQGKILVIGCGSVSQCAIPIVLKLIDVNPKNVTIMDFVDNKKRVRDSLKKADIPQDSVQLIETREEVREMLKLHDYIDLLIPRGSNKFVKYIQENTKIPVLGHSEGICHVYIDKDADISKAVSIAFDAKCQYPAVCNAMETLLVDKKIADRFIPLILDKYLENNVEVRCDADTLKIIASNKRLSKSIKKHKKSIKKAVEKFGKLDIMANNAGILVFGTVEQLTEKEWDRQMAVNLKGVFFGTKYAVQQMKKQGNGGRIINISSIAGLVGFPGISAYCASKGGVTEFTREAALDHAKDGITVNAINPGVIVTDMTKGMLGDKKTNKSLMENTPVGRFGQPEDIGNAAVFLAMDESSFITGHNLVVDGGWTAR